MRHWLMKSEPDSFSIHDLAAAPRRRTGWDGVRNYQARNYLREMKVGDRVLFYHSSTDPPAVVGAARVVREAYPDATAWDPKDHHFDSKASPDNPIWSMVDIELDEVFPAPVELATLRKTPALAKMELLRKGSRLSVMPVTPAEFATVLKLAGKKPAASSAKKKPKR